MAAQRLSLLCMRAAVQQCAALSRACELKRFSLRPLLSPRAWVPDRHRFAFGKDY